MPQVKIVLITFTELKAAEERHRPGNQERDHQEARERNVPAKLQNKSWHISFSLGFAIWWASATNGRSYPQPLNNPYASHETKPIQNIGFSMSGSGIQPWRNPRSITRKAPCKPVPPTPAPASM